MQSLVATMDTDVRSAEMDRSKDPSNVSSTETRNVSIKQQL